MKEWYRKHETSLWIFWMGGIGHHGDQSLTRSRIFKMSWRSLRSGLTPLLQAPGEKLMSLRMEINVVTLHYLTVMSAVIRAKDGPAECQCVRNFCFDQGVYKPSFNIYHQQFSHIVLADVADLSH